MKHETSIAAVLAIFLASALSCPAAYVRGEMVWKCGFTPDEAARFGVAGL